MEIILYELLGVRIFQKMVFLLERIIHWKDKGKNINYHFTHKDKETDFIKYLFYNGSIHIRNIVVIFVYLFIKISFFETSYEDIIIILFGVKDIYCVMLQRYNFLRIQLHLEKKEKIRNEKIERKVDKIQKKNLKKYEIIYKHEDLKLLKRLKETIENKEYFMLSDKDISSLERLSQLLYINEEIEEKKDGV